MKFEFLFLRFRLILGNFRKETIQCLECLECPEYSECSGENRDRGKEIYAEGSGNWLREGVFQGAEINKRDMHFSEPNRFKKL